MADQIPNSFIKQFEADVKDVFQREGGYLRSTVRMKTGIVGRSTTFQRAGKGVATTKARHGVITPMNQDHTAIECMIEDFYAADYVDNLDEAKTNIDERMVIARGGAWALGRKVDDQILTTLATSANTPVTWTVTSKAEIFKGALEIVSAIFALDVPNDGNVWAVVTPKQWARLGLVDQFASSDWVDASGRVFTNGIPTGGKAKSWLGVNWMMHTGVSGFGTASATGMVWHKQAVGYATGAHAMNRAENDMVSAKIDYVPERAAHFVNNWMSGGACLIEDAVIKFTFADNAAIPTT
jgi:hypothetical protein